jgi:putative peptidoglycan lipid II flippase
LATIASATISIAIGTICSTVIGAIQSILVAKYFGIGAGLDAFYVSIILPMIIIGLVVGAMQASIIPVFIEHNAKGKEEGYIMFNCFFTLSLVVFSFLTLVMISFSDIIVSLTAPGFKDERFSLASNLMKVAAPIVLLGGASDLISAVFNANKKFTFPAFGNVIHAVISLICLLLFKSQGVYALVIGLLAGSLVRCLYMILGAARNKMGLGLNFNFNNQGVKQVFQVMIPMFLGTTFSHVNITVDQIMASTLSTGSVSALNYANNINSMITQLFIFSLGSAILPFFSHHVAEGKIDDLRNTFFVAVKVSFFILMPMTVFIFVLGTPLIQVLLQRGAFDQSSTLAVSGAWKAFSLGLTVFAVGIITVRVLTSLQLTRLLAYIAFLNIFINVALNFVLMKHMAHVGIALSTSLTYMCAVFLQVYFTGKYVGQLHFKELFVPVAKITAFSLISGFAAYGVLGLGVGITLQNVCLLAGAAIALYLVLSWIGKVKELDLLLGHKMARLLR